MHVVLLGNVAVREVIGADDDGAPIHRRYRGQQTVKMLLPTDEDGWTHDERIRQAAHDDGHWPRLSSKPPAWVESDNAEIEAALSEEFGCPVGRPAGWVDHIEAI